MKIQKEMIWYRSVIISSFLLLTHLQGKCQSEQIFEYLKNRAAKVNISYYQLTDGEIQTLPTNGVKQLNLKGEETYFIIRFTQLTLGLEPASLKDKNKKDPENFYLSIPSSPEYITQSAKGLVLKEITNDGRLSDLRSKYVNKTLEVKYLVTNKTIDTIDAEIFIKFEIDAFPEKTPIRSSDKGGRLLKINIRISPLEQTVLIDGANKLFQKITSTDLSVNDKNALCQKYLTEYSEIDESRTLYIRDLLRELSQSNVDTNIEERILNEVKRYFQREDLDSCLLTCHHYLDQMESGQISGKYLQTISGYAIRCSKDPKEISRWNKYQAKNPAEWNDRSKKMTDADLYSEMESPPDSTTLTSLQDSTDMIDPLLLLEESTVSDFGIISINEKSNEITLHTGDLSKNYVLKFFDAKTNHLVTNPSFRGAEKQITLDDLNLKNGDYKVLLFNSAGIQLAESFIHYRKRKLSAEFKYLSGLSIVLLIFFIYHRYFKI